MRNHVEADNSLLVRTCEIPIGLREANALIPHTIMLDYRSIFYVP